MLHMTYFRCKNVIVASLLILIAAGVSFAQKAGNGRISGTITDSTGAAIPGQSVRIIANTAKTDIDKIATRVLTDSLGRYLAEALPPGEYTVTVDAFGMVYRNAKVKVTASETTILDATVTYETNCKGDPAPLKPTEDDRAWIVNDLLSRALIEGIPDRNLLLRQEGPIVLSSENINAERVTPPVNFKISIMSAKDIQTLADAHGDFLYLRFGNWKLRPGCAVVTLSNSWAVGRRSGMGYLSGGGITYLYTMKSGKWKAKSLGGWIS